MKVSTTFLLYKLNLRSNEMILVSACLCGINCKYSGGNNYNEKIFELIKNGNAIPICPEQLRWLADSTNSR